jgi:hypothetical protein
MKQGTLECTCCRARFEEDDVRALRFFASTSICLECYKRGQAAPYALWCFGKPNVIGKSGRIVQFGFDVQAEECREQCPDRKLCELFVKGRLGKRSGKNEDA